VVLAADYAVTLLSTFIQTQIARSEDGVTSQTFEPRTYWTVPDDIPLPTVTIFDTETQLGEGYIFFSPYPRRRGSSHYKSYRMIVDNRGELIHYDKNQAYPDVDYHDFKALPNGYLVYAQRFHRLLDSSYQPAGIVSYGNRSSDFHEIQLLPNGNYMFFIYHERAVDMSEIVEGGDPDAVHIDCHLKEVQANGLLVFEWHSNEHFAITDTYKSLLDSQIDGVHCNSVDLDHDGNLLISNRDLYEVTKIDRNTGDVIWRLGGKNNQFEFINAIDAEDVIFEKQHDARRVPNGNLMLFDNRLSEYSRAIEYSLDETNMTATLVWEHRHTPDIFSARLGNAQRLSNGNTLVSWSYAETTLTEINREGATLLEMALPKEMTTYRSYRLPWVGHPVTVPDLVIIQEEEVSGENIGTDDPQIRALKLAYSWNGATEVTAYQVYGDSSEHPQNLLTTEPKNGFETITVFEHELLITALAENYNFRVVPLGQNGEPFMENETAAAISSPVVSTSDAITHIITPTFTQTSDAIIHTLTPTFTQNNFLPLIRY